MDKELEYRDRVIAWLLAPVSFLVGYTLVCGSHGLWHLPVVSYVIFPLGCFLALFWLFVAMGFLPLVIQEFGWWISIFWHFGWLAYLLATILGIFVVLSPAPLLVLLLIVAGCSSVLATQDIRRRIRDVAEEAEQVGDGDAEEAV